MALCAGIGGLELGLGMATGGRARPVVYVERDAYAAAVLLARMEDEALGRAPVWDDLATFDARPWRGAVDCVAAGFPCQPWSVAGKRKGTADARWIWPDIARIIEECEPGLVFIENVPGLYRHGLRVVLSDLATLGFDAEWTSVRASDVGAPHRRERVFILAYRDAALRDEPGRRGCERSEGLEQERPSEVEPVHAGEELAEPEQQGRSLQWSPLHDDGRDAPGDDANGRDADVADAARIPGGERTGRERVLHDGAGLGYTEGNEQWWARLSKEGQQKISDRGSSGGVGDPDESGRQGWSLPRRECPDELFAWPPSPADGRGWRDYIRAGGPEPAIRGGASRLSDRLDRLRCLGNGVVPQQAALAFRILSERIGL